jgi:membrane protein required for colicin V production
MVSWPINTFDAAIYIFLFLAVVMGFMTGLLRSLATIFGYVATMGIVVALAPQLAPLLSAQFRLSPAQAWIALGIIFVLAGIALGALLRVFVNEMVGPNVSIPDRVAGAMLGAVRVILVAVAGPGVRPHHPAGPRAGVPERLAMAPGAVAGRPERPALAAAGGRGLHRSPEKTAESVKRGGHARRNFPCDRSLLRVV